MATHKSAKQRIRRNARRATVNGARIGRVRTFVKKVEQAIQSGDKQAAQSAFKTAQPELHRSVSKGVQHASTVGRKLSRLNARIKAMA